MEHTALRFYRDLSAEENWKLQFPSRFEGAVLLGWIFLTNHYR